MRIHPTSGKQIARNDTKSVECALYARCQGFHVWSVIEVGLVKIMAAEPMIAISFKDRQ